MEASKPSKGPFLADYDPDPSVRTEKFDKAGQALTLATSCISSLNSDRAEEILEEEAGLADVEW